MQGLRSWFTKNYPSSSWNGIVFNHFNCYSEDVLFIKLKQLYINAISDTKTPGYYEILGIFRQAQFKSSIIFDALLDSIIFLAPSQSVIHIWIFYIDCSHKLEKIFRIGLPNIIKERQIKNIKTTDLAIICQMMFYHNFIDRLDFSSKIIDQVENISQIIRSVKLLMELSKIFTSKLFTLINRPSLKQNLYQLLKKTNCIDSIIRHLHFLILEHQQCNDEIKELAHILAKYGSGLTTSNIYQIYLQSRITGDKYNLDLEFQMIDLIFGIIDNHQFNKLSTMINDINDSHEFSQILSKNIAKPLILTQNVWKVRQLNSKIKYPDQIESYIVDITETFEKLNGDIYTINWQSTMGIAEFTFHLNNDVFPITCYMLQAIALIHFNSYNPIKLQEFCQRTLMSNNLAEKIFESLLKSEIIIYTKSVDKEYQINQKYNGIGTIDLRKYFTEILN